MKKLAAVLAAAIAMLALVATAASAAPISTVSIHNPYCGIHWGSGPKHAGTMVGSRVRTVMAGEHACFDRLVIELGAGKKPGYRVGYVARIIQDPSGKVIPVRGGAKLHIAVLAPARAGFPVNSRHLVNVRGFRTFRQAVAAGSFEGITSFGLGVRARLPFRVFILNGPGAHHRLVIDVANRWQA
jgi:hypothetical protein